MGNMPIVSFHCYSITLSDKMFGDKTPENQLARAMDATGASRAIAIHNACEWGKPGEDKGFEL
jgi:hypothetical protein